MREVLSLHVGQCGVQMGSSLWEQYCLEHDVRLDGTMEEGTLTTQGFSSFFVENDSSKGTKKCSPIAMFVDLEPTVADQVREGKTKGLYRPDQIFSWTEDAAGLFPRGYYLSEKKLMISVHERVRRFLESFDSFQGLMLMRSIGGGTGSGYTSLLLDTLSKDLVKKSVLDMAVYPSKGMGVIEPYNALLSTHSTAEQIEMSFMMGNDAIFRISMDADTSSFQSVNRLVAHAVSSITAGIRFAGSLNVDLSEFPNNLVPFPRIKFPFVSYAPIVSRGDKARETVQAMTKACFEGGNRMFSVSAELGEYVAVCLVYSGDVAQKEVVEAVSHVKEQGLAKFVSWSPGLKIGINHKRPIIHPEMGLRYNGVSLGAISNSTSTGDYWRDMNNRFDLMFRKGAFLHWFFIEGTEKEEFRQARENSAAIENDYRDLGNSSPGGDAKTT